MLPESARNNHKHSASPKGETIQCGGPLAATCIIVSSLRITAANPVRSATIVFAHRHIYRIANMARNTPNPAYDRQLDQLLAENQISKRSPLPKRKTAPTQSKTDLTQPTSPLTRDPPEHTTFDRTEPSNSQSIVISVPDSF
jgi:hypothetical protein